MRRSPNLNMRNGHRDRKLQPRLGCNTLRENQESSSEEEYEEIFTDFFKGQTEAKKRDCALFQKKSPFLAYTKRLNK